ncbi:MAG: hypothetical protein M3R24_01330 [Chloroflexota bacterium]|nr:hypothetical protein [Chloroflexota bacterium]PLS83739.1 MAG: hypothetical protein CYG59_00230 [Chloroflexota bacterium]
MAEIRILTPEQLEEREQKPKGRSGRRRSDERTRIIEEYKTALRDVQPGFGGDVNLGEDEEKRTVRQNLKAAAQELNMALEFRPIKDKSRIHFRVITTEQAEAKPKRGGRPRKNRAAE